MTLRTAIMTATGQAQALTELLRQIADAYGPEPVDDLFEPDEPGESLWISTDPPRTYEQSLPDAVEVLAEQITAIHTRMIEGT